MLQQLKNDLQKLNGFNKLIETNDGLTIHSNNYMVKIQNDINSLVNITIVHDLQNYDLKVRFVNLKKVNIIELINNLVKCF